MWVPPKRRYATYSAFSLRCGLGHQNRLFQKIKSPLDIRLRISTGKKESVKREIYASSTHKSNMFNIFILTRSYFYPHVWSIFDSNTPQKISRGVTVFAPIFEDTLRSSHSVVKLMATTTPPPNQRKDSWWCFLGVAVQIWRHYKKMQMKWQSVPHQFFYANVFQNDVTCVSYFSAQMNVLKIWKKDWISALYFKWLIWCILSQVFRVMSAMGFFIGLHRRNPPPWALSHFSFLRQTWRRRERHGCTSWRRRTWPRAPRRSSWQSWTRPWLLLVR